MVIANELLYSWKGFESGMERVESAISSHVRCHLGSGFVTGATEKSGQIANHCWGRLGTGLKASEAELTGVGFAVATEMGASSQTGVRSCREYTT